MRRAASWIALFCRLGESAGRFWCCSVWSPMAKPALIASFRPASKALSCWPTMKKVAGARRRRSVFTNCGVSGPGPSSMVSATSFLAGLPREMNGV